MSTEFSFQRTFYFFPFFVVGAILNDYRRSSHELVLPRKMLGGGILLIFGVLYTLFAIKSHQCQCPFYGSYCYSNGYNVLTRISSMIVGMAISLLIFKYFPINRLFALIGTETLTIYLFHSFIVEQISHNFIDSRLISCDILSIIIISISVTLGLFLFAKISVSRWIINPLTRLNAFIKSRQLKL